MIRFERSLPILYEIMGKPDPFPAVIIFILVTHVCVHTPLEIAKILYYCEIEKFATWILYISASIALLYVELCFRG
jgi:hypothetical protein